MTKTLAEIITQIERVWPIDSAESWDNPGLSFGKTSKPVVRAVLAVDATPDVIEEAAAIGADLLITHHPVIFRSLTTLAGSGATHLVLAKAIELDIALFSAHTNVDHIDGGVSHTLATSLGLESLSPLDAESGHGRIGNLPRQTSLGEFSDFLAAKLPGTTQGVMVQGNPAMAIRRVAVLAGAGDSFIDGVFGTDADVYVTSDLRHHPALDFKTKALQANKALINISHWAAESLWLEGAALKLRNSIEGVDFTVSKLSTDPWDYAVNR